MPVTHSDRQFKIAIDFHRTFDVGTLTLSLDRLVDALMVEFFLRNGGPYGRLPESQEQRLRELRPVVRPAVEEWMRTIGNENLNTWLRMLTVTELFARILPLDRLLPWLEDELAAGHAQVLAVPSVLKALTRVRTDRSSAVTQAHRDTVKRIVKGFASMDGGRPRKALEKRADTKLAEEASRTSLSEVIKKNPHMQPDSVRRAITRGRKNLPPPMDGRTETS